MKGFKQLPLTAAVLGALFTSTAFAETANTQAVDLGTEVIKIDRQGAKVQTNVVTLQEKNESTATDLRSLLKDEPAIEFGGGNGTSQFWSIRGMGQNSIDVKIDNAYDDSSILYHQGRHMLDPALVKVVEVQKGAGSASAGIGATNGAIVAKTVDAHDLLKGSDKNYGIRINGGYSSNDGHSYGLAAFGKTENFDLLLAGNRVDEKDYKPGEGYLINKINQNDTVPASALDKISYLAKAGVTLGNHRLVLSHMQEQHKGVRTVREEFPYVIVPGDRISTDRQSPAYRETTLTNTNLEYLGHAGIADITANAYVMGKERYSADDSGCGYCGNIAGETTTKIKTKGGNLNIDWNANDLAIVKTGVNYRHQEIEPHTFLNPKAITNPEKEDVGAYVEAIGEIGNITATAGVRYDHFKIKTHDGKEVSNDALNPSFGLIWQPTNFLSFNANHNYATRSPRLYDSVLTHGKRGIISVADNVKAETARNTEVGFNVNHTFANNSRITANGSYFWQKIEDALANPQNRHDVQGVREITNAGYIKNEGYEVGVGYQIGGLTAKAGVAHSKPRIYDTHPQNLLSDNPEFAVQTGRTWTGSLAYRFAKPNLEIGARHRSVERTPNDVLVRNASPANRSSYDVTDIFANWKPLDNDKLNINLAVNNVADKYYQPHSQRPVPVTLPGAGREYRVGVNFTY